MEKRYEVAVIGGGQAGLAMGYHLARQGRDFVILDAAPRVGHSWRTRWDSLTLFTPARYSGLPGLPFPGDPEHLPRKDEVADYLELYTRAFALPVRSGEAVVSLRGSPGEQGFEIETARARYRADQVVVATGPFQRPSIPALAAGLPGEILQLHSSEYRSPAQIASGGGVVVVGGGNSGVQIAAELSASRPTWLSVGEKLPRLPERWLGRSVFWWLERLGLMDVTVGSRIGRRVSARDGLIGGSPETIARERGVRLLGRVERVEDGRLVTGAGERVDAAAVVWATGFRPDFRWIQPPVLDGAGRPVHARGVTGVPGLYFLGLPWQHTRGSALIGWVGRDAAYLAARVDERARAGRAAETPGERARQVVSPAARRSDAPSPGTARP
jgi:putative flavoprotein involved in K+ transport